MTRRAASLLLALTTFASVVVYLSEPPRTRAGSSTQGQPIVYLNGTGGQQSTGSDGIKVALNRSSQAGSDEIWFAGTTQYCCSAASPMLNIGGQLYGEAGPASGSTSWSSMTFSNFTGSAKRSSETQTLGSGSVQMTYTAVRNSRTYRLIRDVSYTYPNDYFTNTFTVEIPDGNTEQVKFYFGGDTAPGGSDSGYGIMLTAPVRTVISLNTGTSIQLGYREVPGSKPFDGATSQSYSAPYTTVQSGGNIGYVVNASNHDAGLMVQWNFGSTPGTYSAAMEMFANKQSTRLVGSFSSATVAAGTSVNLDLSLVNTVLSSRSSLGYTVTLPAGMTVASTPTNACGGTVTATAGSRTIQISGASVASAQSCLLQVPVVAAIPGTFALSASSVAIPSGSNVVNGMSSVSVEATGPDEAPSSFTDSTVEPAIRSTAYVGGIRANGYPAPTYAVTEGALPAGLTLDAITGEITGTPTTAGAYSFTVTATNRAGSTSRTFTGQVYAAQTTPTWSDDTIGAMYSGDEFSDQVSAAGAPDPEYSVSAGTLPAGLTLNSLTGEITGTPTTAGAYTFTIRAANSAGAVTKQFAGTVINGNIPRWTDSTVGAMTSRTAFTDGVAASGNPAPTYAITAGVLPAGLSLNTSTGAITGTPTTHGAYDFTVTATNTAGTVSQRFTGTVADGRTAPSAPAITGITSTTTSMTVDFTLGSDGGDAVTDVQYSLDGGTWTSLSPATTVSPLTITGLQPGTTYEVRLRAVNSKGNGAASGAESERTPALPQFTDATLGSMTSRTAFADGIAASGDSAVTYSISAGTLPAGLSLNTATGAITGTPSTHGPYDFTVTATSNEGSTSLRLTGTIQDGRTAPDAPTITSSSTTRSSVVIDFTLGSDGGDAVTDVQYSLDGTTWVSVNPSTTTSPMTITGLQAGTSYSIRLRAVNSKGVSRASAALIARTQDAPATTPSPTSTTLAVSGTGASAAGAARRIVPTATQRLAATPSRPNNRVLSLPGSSVMIDDKGSQRVVNWTATDSTSWTLRTGPFAIKLTPSSLGLKGKKKRGDKIALDLNQEAVANGEGFMEESEVYIWLFSTPRKLATVKVNADGSFTKGFVIPPDVKPGEHTLQISGITPDGEVRRVSAAIVVDAGADLPQSGGDGLTPLIRAAILIFIGVLLTARRRLQVGAGKLTR